MLRERKHFSIIRSMNRIHTNLNAIAGLVFFNGGHRSAIWSHCKVIKVTVIFIKLNEIEGRLAQLADAQIIASPVYKLALIDPPDSVV